jgi:hypothetical protein
MALKGALQQIDGGNWLPIDAGEHVTRPKPCVERRSAGEDALHDQLIGIAVIDQQPRFIKRVSRGHMLHQGTGLYGKRLLLIATGDRDIHCLVCDAGRGQHLYKLRFGCHRLPVDSNYAVALAQAGFKEQALIREIRDRQTRARLAATEPQTQVGPP